MLDHHKIDYVEFPSADLEKTKAFFATALGWEFENFGPEYTAFSGAGLNGGFFAADLASRTAKGACLIVFYSESLETSLTHFRACGARIVKPIFAFPGGRRFHFAEPMGNEFAVWSDK
jgi:predicted enzyme related to lactoylglutathione lyase